MSRRVSAPLRLLVVNAPNLYVQKMIIDPLKAELQEVMFQDDILVAYSRYPMI
ncbi:hypothetical protein [Pelotomaculum sp. PtaB.Bin117]|uniref:hypothetical protein n=1 Tax=Pelotomaculum sp. PtaB.Bin117 TaxID=1811694 RepID=UPI0009D48C90|nr:hypothetical protein [Pelotomaculum sp. PtaB.Bin117]OPX87043.1 MAG: hypothetical protein A4E54_01802 [Pelotomaculum sp. PtaB.Bin117]